MSARGRHHLDDYERAADGSYVYRGARWHWTHPQERARLLRDAWALLGAALSCLVGAGCVPLGRGIALLAVAPYGLAWVLVALLVASLWRLTREGEHLRAHVHEATVGRLGPLSRVAVVAAFASALGALASPALDMLSWRAAVPFAALMAGTGIFCAQLGRHLATFSFAPDN